MALVIEQDAEEGAGECVGCGYSLRGLAASGACPECGRAYDAECIRLWGRAWVGRGAASLSVEPPHRAMGYLNRALLIGLLVVIVVGDTLWNPRFSYLPLALIIAVWTGLNYLALQRSRVPVQVWLTRSGYAMKRGRGGMKVRAWKGEDVDFRKRPGGGRCLVITSGFRRRAYLEMDIDDARAAMLRDRVREVTGRAVRLER